MRYLRREDCGDETVSEGDVEVVESLREYYRIGLTYTSNALEGNSLTESETKVVIEDGLTIGGSKVCLRIPCRRTVVLEERKRYQT